MKNSKISKAKYILRQKSLEKRRKLDIEIIKEKSKIIYQNLQTLDFSLNFGKKKLGLYYPLHGEPDLLSLFLNNYVNSIISLPKIEKNQIYYVLCSKNSIFKKKNFIFEPKGEDLYIIKPEILLIPGLVFSREGYRIGFGYGFYDRYIKKNARKIITIGVCFNQELSEKFSYSEFDQKLNYIVTETEILKI